MKAIGKITRDDFCTHSLVPYLFDKGHFKSKQEVLNDCIRARHGESIRTPQTLRQRTGDVLEKPLIQECMKRLGIKQYEDKINNLEWQMTTYEDRLVEIQRRLSP